MKKRECENVSVRENERRRSTKEGVYVCVLGDKEITTQQ